MQLNPHQEEVASHWEGRILTLAGPGSGKTRTLTARTGRLIRKGVAPGSILCLTFTRRRLCRRAGYHHHIGLNTWQSLGGSPPPLGSTGLYHVAILYPTRPALANALRRLMAANIALDGVSDHGVSEALYLRDPDDNGLELYRDRPPEEWPRAPQGELAMLTRRLDVEGLLREGPMSR